MKKILFVSNTSGFFKFNKPYIQKLNDLGYQVDNVSPGNVIEYKNHITIDMSRFPITLKNIQALFKIKRLIECNNYDIIHCHTPTGGLVSRLALKYAIAKKTSIIYTAHGFHFYKKSPLYTWFLFYPMELYLSQYTDIIVTINEEDYILAQKKKLAKKGIFRINSIGVDLKKFHRKSDLERQLLREKYGFSQNDFIIIYVAQFIKRKNHKYFINQLSILRKSIPNIKVFFVGSGNTQNSCIKLSNKMSLNDIVYFWGEISEVNILYNMADIHVSTSVQEGLSMNNVEAMATGLPIVCSDIRGHRDSVIHTRNGFLFNLKKPKEMTSSILNLFNNPNLAKEISINNQKDSLKFDINNSLKSMIDIYNQLMHI